MNAQVGELTAGFGGSERVAKQVEQFDGVGVTFPYDIRNGLQKSERHLDALIIGAKAVKALDQLRLFESVKRNVGTRVAFIFVKHIDVMSGLEHAATEALFALESAAREETHTSAR